MFFFVKGRVEEFAGLPSDDIQKLVQKEIEALQALKAAGKLVAAYEASEGQERMGIANVESRDELEQALADLPMAPYLKWEEILPVLEL